MRQFGKVDIPQNAFLNALKMNDEDTLKEEIAGNISFLLN